MSFGVWDIEICIFLCYYIYHSTWWLNHKTKGEIIMKYSKNPSQKIAKTVASILDSVLKTEANSTSCCVIYQPKAPKELERFKKKK